MNSFQYDDFGRVKKKKINNDTHAIRYTYNLHGQLQSIASDYFSQTLRYQNGTTQKYYNGSISEIDETTLSSNSKLYHAYKYDGINRLQYTTTGLTATGKDFSSEYSYDKNGNINTLFRNGFLRDLSSPSTPVINDYIDRLQIDYSGNRINRVNDYADNPIRTATIGNNDFKKNNSCSTSYLYDANGNLMADCNKNIAWIKYNSLNLPNKVQMSNGNKIEYLYDASGQKRKSTYSVVLNSMQIPLGNTSIENTTNISSVSTREYFGNMVYRNGQLERISTPEGYVITSGSNPQYWNYVYQIKDYQGNVRSEGMSGYIKDNIGMRPCPKRYATDYYSFGMEIVSKFGQSIPNPAPPQLFSGNELERTDPVV